VFACRAKVRQERLRPAGSAFAKGASYATYRVPTCPKESGCGH
jgi:hypothetical protein